ncbi:hypothetical protein QUF99_16420 [Bacillus sp. DX4.1]|uniref:hypothetical protein n=1 Tax=Bacillus sp. DX4.1 TaxID=3055867 RepID=UPI00259FE171|nr:hypothetical protein [Bacillus sp. DX4.1]MDM5188843.1 hypothetical protein [Bacillus sp. DX4.1]
MEINEHQLYTKFIEVAHVFNKELQIVPVLYGSLGLQVIFNKKEISTHIEVSFLLNNQAGINKIANRIGEL